MTNNEQNNIPVPSVATSNRDKYFKGQQDNEHFVCFMRHHWIVLIREFLYFLIFAVLIYFMLVNIDTIIGFLQGGGEPRFFVATVYLIATLFLHRFFIKIFNFFINVGIITDIRFIDHQKSLFLRDTMDSIDMAQIQNVERLGEGILPSIFRYGDLKIFLTAASGVKTFSHIPNVQFHFRCLNRCREERQHQLLRERSLYSMPSAVLEQSSAEQAQPAQQPANQQPPKQQPAQPTQQSVQTPTKPTQQSSKKTKQAPPSGNPAVPAQKKSK